MPAPDHNTICAIEARLHEMARDLRMSFDELVEAIQHVRAFRDFAERQRSG